MARSRSGVRTGTRGPRRVPAVTDAEPPTEARTGDDQAAIRVRAYELYEARGGAPGHALDDWLAAERQLRAARP